MLRYEKIRIHVGIFPVLFYCNAIVSLRIVSSILSGRYQISTDLQLRRNPNSTVSSCFLHLSLITYAPLILKHFTGCRSRCEHVRENERAHSHLDRFCRWHNQRTDRRNVCYLVNLSDEISTLYILVAANPYFSPY